MEIPELNPDASYEDSTTYYHGFGGVSNLAPILDRGDLLSPGRMESDPDAKMAEMLYEDVLRHSGEEIAAHEFSSQEDVWEYAQAHRDDLLEDGHQYTKCLLESDSFPEARPPDFFQRNMVWVSRDRTEAKNHSGPEQVAGDPDGTSGYFKIELPDESVLDIGLTAGVPGHIPLEFADELYIDVNDEESREIWIDCMAGGHDIDISRF